MIPNILRVFISKNRIEVSRYLVVFGMFIVMWFIYRGYFHESFININKSVSLDNASKIGDFIGGVVGAIFTLVGIVLLYERTKTLMFDQRLNKRTNSEKRGVSFK